MRRLAPVLAVAVMAGMLAMVAGCGNGGSPPLDGGDGGGTGRAQVILFTQPG